MDSNLNEDLKGNGGHMKVLEVKNGMNHHEIHSMANALPLNGSSAFTRDDSAKDVENH